MKSKGNEWGKLYKNRIDAIKEVYNNSPPSVRGAIIEDLEGLLDKAKTYGALRDAVGRSRLRTSRMYLARVESEEERESISELMETIDYNTAQQFIDANLGGRKGLAHQLHISKETVAAVLKNLSKKGKLNKGYTAVAIAHLLLKKGYHPERK